MTSSLVKLQHVVPYTGTFSVQAANRDHLPIVHHVVPYTGTFSVQAANGDHLPIVHHVVPYTGIFSVQAASGDHLPIVSMGTAPGPFPLTNIFVSPHLATNLVSAGQLVENNYKVSFSSSSSVVKD